MLPRTSGSNCPEFLNFGTGDFVVVRGQYASVHQDPSDWWVGKVICIQGGARDSDQNSIFQVINIDTNVISWVNADLVTHLLKKNAE